MIRKISKWESISKDRRRSMMSTVEGKKLIYNIPITEVSKDGNNDLVYYIVYVNFSYAVESKVVVSIRYKRSVTASTYTNKEVSVNKGERFGSILVPLNRPYNLSITGVSPSKDDVYIYWE